jgi:hypothetical protein
VLPLGDEDNDDGAETARDPGRKRDIRDFKDMRDECGVAGVFDATVVEEAEAGDRGGMGPMPVEDVELDFGGFFREDLIGDGAGMCGDVDRESLKFA